MPSLIKAALAAFAVIVFIAGVLMLDALVDLSFRIIGE